MPIINWDEKFSVSNKTIDDQHKQLVKLINDLFDSMRSGKSKDILESLLKELVSYTVYHFTAEEKMLQDANYPELAGHKKIHQTFVDKINEFKTDYDEGNIYISLEMINYLKEWILEHILHQDKQYMTYI